MAVIRDIRDGTWRYRKVVELPDGRKIRISGTPMLNTKLAAEAAERAHIHRTFHPSVESTQRKEVPTFNEFADLFLEIGTVKNKPSEVASKESILRVHLRPAFGKLRLDRIGYTEIQDYVARKVRPIATGGEKVRALSQKSVNNTLTVLRRLLVVAKKRGLIVAVPEIEWLHPPEPEFDFLDFEEADRLVEAAEGEWRTMILVALRTGMRQGEILALRWEDVDLVSGTAKVRRSVTRGIISDPKSRKTRDIPLGNDVQAALKAHRHLRGELVFSTMAGRMLKKNEVKHPLWRATRKAGLRHIGWHTLRHSFASHLAMQGVPLKAVQELMGHATIEMTMRYAHLSPHVPRDAVRTLDRAARGNSVTTAGKSVVSS